MKDLRIHSHPILERKLNVPEDHVIIDGELFRELLRKFGNKLPKDNSNPWEKKGEMNVEN